MRSLNVKFILVAALCFLFGISVFANSVDFGLEVDMPRATSIKATLSEIDSAGTETPDDDTWVEIGQYESGTVPIDFTGGGHTMEEQFDPQGESLGIFLTGFYYAVDVTPVGGGWDPSNVGLTLAYAPGAKDFADHATAGLVRIIYDPDTGLGVHAGGVEATLYNLRSLPSLVPYSYVEEGWLRIYIGLATGSDAEEAFGVTPFTAATEVGEYTGTLTISYSAM